SRIRQLRLAKNIKIAELAEAVGVDAANISRLETGKQKQFSEQTLNRLAQALSVSVPDLFTSDENDNTVHINSKKYASPVKDV
ncbi:helix-turn-helix transcriptional regulator, partial [Klebsiella pneumoniae]|nr:helix-turn-helix transcriptional regulator [Klebsiella pneumoniae]